MPKECSLIETEGLLGVGVAVGKGLGAGVGVSELALHPIVKITNAQIAGNILRIR